MKLSLMVISIFLVALMIVGCSPQQQQQTQLNLGGSSSGMIILEPVIKAFETKYPGYKINILPGTQTSDAIKGVSEGLLDIGSQARPMKASEKETYTNVDEILFVKDAMVLGVNPNVQVSGLTTDQLKKIYSGEILDWSEVGGKAGKIVVLDREEEDSSKILLRERIIGNDLKISEAAVILHSAGDMNKAIAETSNSLGYSSFGTITKDKLNIKSLAIDGVMPTIENTISGKYPLVRTYALTVPKGELTGGTKLFVDFLFSDESRQILESYGYLPLDRTPR
jgi:phosphate transport system substrate-binding protein